MVQVSIVMPCYNASAFIKQSIDSVITQTFSQWELIVVDDCSSDNSREIVNEYTKKDNRIILLQSNKPSGSPAIPRNMGIEAANGRYIAFLDSDDLWAPSRLERQLPLFNYPDAAIVFSDYKKMDENGTIHEKTVQAPLVLSYKKMLECNYIGCLTAVYDTNKVGKMYFKKRGHEDYVLWLNILSKGFKAYNTNTVEAYYRVNADSVSSNKKKALRWQWNILREEAKLPCFKACYYFAHYAVKAFLKSRK